MKKICIFFLLFLALSAAYSACDDSKHLYTSSYICRDLKGNPRWKAIAKIRHKEGDIYNITETAKGIYFGFNGKISWVAEMDFEETEDTVRPLRMKRSFFDDRGKLIAFFEQKFSFDDDSVTCIHKDVIKNTSKKKKFKFTKDIINRLLLGVYVKKFIDEGQVSKKIQLVSPEPGFYNLEIKVVDTEEIEINGRKRRAYKLCLDPQLGLLNFVKIFLPKAYVWHSTEGVFEWLQYEGVENSINSPEVKITTLD